jgi:hypothetical protein
VNKSIISMAILALTAGFARAQTDVDGIMMAKKNLCIGPMYGFGSWTEYWEGSLLRTNENLGKVSTRMASIMGNYGISDNLNVLFMAPWIKNSASAGTLHSMQGIQDLSLFGKYRFANKEYKAFRLSLMGVLGASVPLTNYTPDFLPLSIGMHSKNAMARVLVDLQRKTWFFTGSFQYMVRSNITLDRNSYYDTELRLTDKVAMPDMWNTNFRAGYRKGEMYLEAIVDKMNTVGGFDIRRNDMPFPSNNMDAFRAGVNVKIPIPKVNGLTFVGGSMYTLSGRNMGKSLMTNLGFFYLMDLGKKTK